MSSFYVFLPAAISYLFSVLLCCVFFLAHWLLQTHAGMPYRHGPEE
jgi:hypothetical protein